MVIALFHSVLGVRLGIIDAAERFRSAGHEVHVVDQYNGLSFNTYEDAQRHVEEMGGYPALIQPALDGVKGLRDGFVAAGFSNGAGCAEYVTTQRRVSGCLIFSGALPLKLLGVEAWPSGVPAQIHVMTNDPLRTPGWTDELAASIRAAGATVEVFEYPGHGHLFTDASIPAEYDPAATALLWPRALAFCARAAST